MKVKKCIAFLGLFLISIAALASSDEYFFAGGDWVGRFRARCNSEYVYGTATLHVVPGGLVNKTDPMLEFFHGTLTTPGMPASCTTINFSKTLVVEPQSVAAMFQSGNPDPKTPILFLSTEMGMVKLTGTFQNNNEFVLSYGPDVNGGDEIVVDLFAPK